MFGSNFSLMNYDTLSTHPWNCMNLHMNQAYEHMQTWPGLFQTQRYSFDNYTPYGNNYSNTFLLDPMYTMMQASWGTPAWNNGPWNNPNGGWNIWAPWGGNWGGGSSSSSSSSTDPEQLEHREKYTKLSNLAKELVEYDGLSNTEKRTLKAAINNTSGTDEEKYERLLKAYKEISGDTVEEFLAEGGQNLAVKDPSASGNDSSKNNFYYQLTQTGYEYKNTEMDKQVEKFHNSIKNELKGNDGSAEVAAGEILKLSSANILDFISSYNSKYSKSNDPKRIIKHISENWSDVGGKMKSTVGSTIVTPLVDALISKAQDVRKYLDEDAEEMITEAIEELETAKSKSKESADSNLSDAFDKLYLLTRQGAIAKVRNDAIAYYGEIDSKVFDDKLFADEVKKDLIAEGFDDADIDETEVKVSKEEAKKSSKSKKSEAEETPEEREAREAKEAKEAEERKAKRNEKKAEEAKTMQTKMASAGVSLNTHLSGWAWSDESSIAVNDTLSNVSKENVMILLNGYYITAGKLGATEGLIERLDDECDGGKIEMENKKKLINSLLEVAKDAGLETSAHYIKIQTIMKKYETGHDCAEKTTFNNGHIDNSLSSDGVWSAIGTIFGSWFVGLKTDNELIDEHMEALFQEIKAKQGT